MTERQLKHRIRNSYSVIDIIKKFITDDFEEKQVGEFIRLHPCPFTGSENYPCSILRKENGFEYFTLFSNNFLDDSYNDIPDKGDVYDLIRGLFPNDSTVQLFLRLMKNHVPPTKITKRKKGTTSKKMVFLSQESLDKLQQEYRSNALHFPKALQDLAKTRKLSEETLEKFQIGVRTYYQRVNDKDGSCPYPIRIDSLTFPCIIDGQVKHFRYRGNKRWQEGHNSGGFWFFNEDALKKKNIIFVEGEIDAMMIWQVLKKDAVAVCGNFSEKTSRFQKLIQIEDRNIYLWFDNDETGWKYRDFIVKHLSEKNNIKIIEMLNPDYNDPDECLRGDKKIEVVELEDFLARAQSV